MCQANIKAIYTVRGLQALVTSRLENKARCELVADCDFEDNEYMFNVLELLGTRICKNDDAPYLEFTFTAAYDGSNPPAGINISMLESVTGSTFGSYPLYADVYPTDEEAADGFMDMLRNKQPIWNPRTILDFYKPEPNVVRVRFWHGTNPSFSKAFLGPVSATNFIGTEIPDNGSGITDCEAGGLRSACGDQDQINRITDWYTRRVWAKCDDKVSLATQGPCYDPSFIDCSLINLSQVSTRIFDSNTSDELLVGGSGGDINYILLEYSSPILSSSANAGEYIYLQIRGTNTIYRYAYSTTAPDAGYYVVTDVQVGGGAWTTSAGPTMDPTEIYDLTGDVSVQTIKGNVCTVSVIDSFTGIDYVNFVPVASAVVVTGTPQVGETLTCTYTYTDVEGDLEDLSPPSRVTWLSYPTLPDFLNDLNSTTIGNGDTYTLTSSEVDIYVAAKVIPYALTGSSPGLEVKSPVIGRIAPSVAAISYETTNAGTHDFDLHIVGERGLLIDWGDGSLESFNPTNNVRTSYAHAYSSGGSKTVSIYVTGSSVYAFEAIGQSIIGNFDLNQCDDIYELTLSTNAINGFTHPPSYTQIWQFFADNNSLSSFALPVGSSCTNLSRWAFQDNSTMTSFTLNGVIGSVLILNCERCNITGVQSLQNLQFGNAQLDFAQNPNMTDVDWTGTSGSLTRWYDHQNDMTGTMTIPIPFANGAIIYGYTNPNRTGLIISSTAVGNRLNHLQLQACPALTLNPDLTDFSLDNNAVLSISGTLATGFTWGPDAKGELKNVGINSSSVSTYLFSGFNGTIRNNCNLSIYDCGFTAAVTNEHLHHLDPVGSGSQLLAPVALGGIIRIEGTNAAPDSTSGGFNGTASAANIIVAGYALTTS